MTGTILAAGAVSQNILPAAADNRGTRKGLDHNSSANPPTPHDACLRACYIHDKDVTKLIPSKTLVVFCQVMRGLLATLARHFTRNRQVSKWWQVLRVHNIAFPRIKQRSFCVMIISMVNNITFNNQTYNS
jgi:hypothetical protein